MTVVNTIPDINNTWQYIYWNFAKIFIAGKSSVGAGPLWFVFTLYSVSLLFYLVQRVSSKAGKVSSFAVAAFALSSLVSGWLMFKNHIRLPLGGYDAQSATAILRTVSTSN